MTVGSPLATVPHPGSMATVLSLWPGSPPSTGLGGLLPQKVAKVAHRGINGISLMSIFVCPCTSPFLILTAPALLIIFWTPVADPPPSPCSRPLAAQHYQMLPPPKLGADHASALSFVALKTILEIEGKLCTPSPEKYTHLTTCM